MSSISPTSLPAGRSVPTETPECESSTTAGISTPESTELHNAWPSWPPMVFVAVLVVAVIGFMVARMIAFG